MYGGNPFVCAAVSKVFDILEKDEILKHVQEHILFLEDALDRIAENHDCVLERRGMGFMQGLVLKKEYPVGEVVKKALDEGLVISAGENVLRIVPPLVIQKEDIWKMEEILEQGGVSSKSVRNVGCINSMERN